MLTRLQDDFQDFLFGRSAAIVEQVNDGPRAPAVELMEIYADAYVGRLIEVLEKDFPATARLTGAEHFTDLARAYLASHPPTHFSIRWAGRDLSRFLAAVGETRAAEAAAFEWMLGESFDAADVRPLTDADLAAVAPADWAGIRFGFAPSVRRIDLSWAVPRLREALDAGRTPPRLRRARAPRPWLAWRDPESLRVRYRSLAADEARALDAALAGHPFAEICDGLGDPLRTARLVRRWLVDGLLAGIS
jgi:hypothetical protein